ncbi:nicotinamide-nucleotide adenylyltransferase [Candidatus Woesearchaeota archaeon]|nr:nicotinamide-nucleotide adenylyltransferase [Candidatus Woesearchaeota archaeon]|tara:strand:+ start:19364 stop:19867 length:504 start_codon:yes stop_codon:yes gene_type:complete
MATALFIGRFQPFHNGHLSAIKQVLDEMDRIIIGIGSSQHFNNKENPFAFEERFKMIENSLLKEEIETFTIFPVPDIPDDKKWVEHVKTILPRFDVVYSGNPRTLKLFREYKNKKYKVKEVKIVEGTASTGIRKLMKEGGSWKELVPGEVAKFINGINGCKRLKRFK